MEAARLNGPPDWLENIVLLAIPPAARETVAGDLWETFSTPHHYAAEALRTVPLVILSQMRRNLNLPALILQSALIFICLGTMTALAMLPVLMLRDAYRPRARPCPRRAMRDAILLSSGVILLLLQVMSLRLPARAGLDHFNWLSLFLQALLLSPVLCIFRAGLILQSDRGTPAPAGALPMEELARLYRAFLRRRRRRHLLEAAALAVAAAGLFLVWNKMAAGLFALVAVYLLLEAASFPLRCDFVALRARYQQALMRQQQLRRFLRWLWATPGLILLYTKLVESGLAAGRPVATMLGGTAMAILCFLIAALNREQDGRVQEQVSLLDRMSERTAPG